MMPLYSHGYKLSGLRRVLLGLVWDYRGLMDLCLFFSFFTVAYFTDKAA